MENHKAIAGMKTKQRSGGGFNPVWAPEAAGEWIRGTYLGTSEFPTGRGDEKAVSHNFALVAGEASLVKSKESVKLEAGLVVSVSGSILNDSMNAVTDKGLLFAVIFMGYGKAKKGQNAAKLFEVHEIEKDAIPA